MNIVAMHLLFEAESNHFSRFLHAMTSHSPPETQMRQGMIIVPNFMTDSYLSN